MRRLGSAVVALLVGVALIVLAIALTRALGRDEDDARRRAVRADLPAVDARALDRKQEAATSAADAAHAREAAQAAAGRELAAIDRARGATQREAARRGRFHVDGMRITKRPAAGDSSAPQLVADDADLAALLLASDTARATTDSAFAAADTARTRALAALDTSATAIARHEAVIAVQDTALAKRDTLLASPPKRRCGTKCQLAVGGAVVVTVAVVAAKAIPKIFTAGFRRLTRSA